MKPRATFAVAPLVVTVLNCAATIGWDARRFRERLLPLCPSAFRSGAIAGAPADEVLEALRELGGDDAPHDPREDDDEDDVDQPRDEGAVLARIGLRKAAPR